VRACEKTHATDRRKHPRRPPIDENTHSKNTQLAKNEQKTPKDTNYSGDKQKGPKKKVTKIPK
jgi:hypothetical protein